MLACFIFCRVRDWGNLSRRGRNGEVGCGRKKVMRVMWKKVRVGIKATSHDLKGLGERGGECATCHIAVVRASFGQGVGEDKHLDACEDWISGVGGDEVRSCPNVYVV